MKEKSGYYGSEVEYEKITGLEMIDEVKELFIEYAESLNVDLGFQDFQAELSELPGKYSPPDGTIIVARVKDRAAGCIALRKINADICEMKRLYVRDDFRKMGIGRKLVAMILEEAKKLNYNYIRLDTLPTMRKAQDLYLALGFYDIDPYVYNPVPGTRFMELDLKVKLYDY